MYSGLESIVRYRAKLGPRVSYGEDELNHPNRNHIAVGERAGADAASAVQNLWAYNNVKVYIFLKTASRGPSQGLLFTT